MMKETMNENLKKYIICWVELLSIKNQEEFPARKLSHNTIKIKDTGKAQNSQILF